MELKGSETEGFFAKFEFSKPYLLSASDCESISIEELIRLGGGSSDDFLKLKLHYPETAGGFDLRKEISTLYKSVGAEQILVLGSPVEGIYLTMQALLKKGDRVVILSPAYDALFNVAEHLTGNAHRWFLKNDGNSWALDFEALEKLMSEPTKLLVVNFPHNPTGFLPTKSDLGCILEMADRSGTFIFSDEMYRDMEFNSEDRLPSLTDVYDRSVSLGGASKSWGLPGLRLGWLSIKDSGLYQRIFSLKNYTSMCATQAGEYLGVMAIRAAPELVKKNLAIVQENLRVAENFFEKWKSRFDWIKPMAGTISVVKFNGLSAETFCYDMAEKFGVVLLPIKFMGYRDRYFRIGLGRTNFKENLAAFDQALEQA